jgi:citrate synthase
MHLLIWGKLPTLEQKIQFRRSMARAAAPPQSVVDVISAFPYATLYRHVRSFTDIVFEGNLQKFSLCLSRA